MSCQLGPWEHLEDLASDGALQAAEDLTLRETLGGSPADVVASSGIAVHSGHRDPPEGGVAASVTASVETMAQRLHQTQGGSPRAAADEFGEFHISSWMVADPRRRTPWIAQVAPPSRSSGPGTRSPHEHLGGLVDARRVRATIGCSPQNG
jgi:hypothetical protein